MLVGVELDIEKLPKDCFECPFQLRFKDGQQDDWYMRRCVVTDKIVEYPKPQWCPLKAIPESDVSTQLYKPTEIRCPACGKKAHRIEEIICWSSTIYKYKCDCGWTGFVPMTEET